jgi:predicted amidohydrolase YtcJ
MFWNSKNEALMVKNDVRRGLGKMWQYPDKASELYGDRIHDVQPVPQLISKGFKVHIEDANFEKMQNYISRRDKAGRVWGPDHAIDRPTALRAVTLWAARYIGEEKKVGSIEKGKNADMAILGADYLTVPENQIGKIPVNAVVVDGRLVYGTP